MKRNFNYTRRRKIDRSRVHVTLSPRENGTQSFAAAINLDGLALKPEARVFVEAYAQRSLMRFDFGTVASVGTQESTALSDLDAGERVFFRVKVVDESGRHGLVLAAADGIVPLEPNRDDGQRLPLLEVVYAEDMGQEIWRVEFNEASGPYLKINARVPGASDLLRTPTVRALVLPAILREILTFIALVQGGDLADDDGESWTGRWLLMTRTWYRAEPPVQEEESQDDWRQEAEEWIKGAAGAFADRLGALGMMTQTADSGEPA